LYGVDLPLRPVDVRRGPAGAPQHARASNPGPNA
jgi:hypothetical protein